MAGLKAIKTKIRSVEKTKKVTKAMEAVSAAKMRKAQNKALAGRSYARAAVSILSRVSGSRDVANHALTEVRTINRALYIVITSDKGLAGALNSSVLRAVSADIAKGGLDNQHVEFIAIGRKAQDYFDNRGFRTIEGQSNQDNVSSDFINAIVDQAAFRFIKGEVDIVKIAYQNFISTFEQRPTLRTIFPLSLEELQTVVSDIIPARLAHRATAEGGASEDQAVNYTIEPSEGEILSAILPRLAGIFVYHALLESQASEHSARMVSMKSASDKAGEMRDTLTLKFNKARQAAITREVSEITGGMEAMAN
ncbi:MAG: ATP synthase F1 subunit gamma [Patescibacteria group bacterium]